MLASYPIAKTKLGITVYSQEDRELHANRIIECLPFLESVSNKHYLRVLRNVNKIAFVDFRPRAAYIPVFGICLISTRWIPENDPEIYLMGEMVHEACHGYLFSQRIPLIKSNKNRVERYCALNQKKVMELLRNSRNHGDK